MGIFVQGVWLLNQGETPFVTLRGSHLLGDHFSVVLYLLAPVYRLFPHPATLLWLQTIALSTGALPVYLLAAQRLGSRWWGALLALVYLMYPPLQYLNLFDVHPESFAVPSLL